jgi:hypothetical protein
MSRIEKTRGQTLDMADGSVLGARTGDAVELVKRRFVGTETEMMR